ncbi:hypothetical protein AMTR_s00001p00233320 [Amborella trichopoda]|uniref:Uncharacterized protein n=1 Tax=Amborella trichopoda TaxID=13333 RepID=W1NM84_AMBTC|nr:hypothetical protein AMTR_s00001p00233320 [Amborella trichopoda]
MREAISCFGEQHRGLLSTLLRRGYIGLDCQIGVYISAQQNVANVSAKCLGTLRKDHKTHQQQSTQDNDVLCALRQLGSITNLVCESLLSGFTAPRRQESIISFILKPKLQQPNGQWESTTVALNILCTSSSKVDELYVKDAQKQPETLDDCMNNIDDQLGCSSSHLIRTRVTLLNILTE